MPALAEMNIFYTYIHLRPDGSPFYAGKGKGKRAYDFYNGRNQWHKNIVSKYGKENIIVKFVKVNLTEEQAHSHECEMIACLREFGYEICNLTNGGEGSSGRIYSHTAETKQKIGAAAKLRTGWKHSAETKNKIGIRHKNKFVSEETKQKLSVKAIGRRMSAETIAKIVSKNKGHKMSDATRLALKAANSGRPCSDKCRAAVAAANKRRART